MKRILVGGILTAFLLLMQPSLARMAQDKAPVDQEKVKAAPEPLAFYEKYQVFGPYKVEHAQGHFMLRLIKEDKAGSTDPVIAVVVHDESTYSGFALFEVAEIK